MTRHGGKGGDFLYIGGDPQKGAKRAKKGPKKGQKPISVPLLGSKIVDMPVDHQSNLGLPGFNQSLIKRPHFGRFWPFLANFGVPRGPETPLPGTPGLTRVFRHFGQNRDLGQKPGNPGFGVFYKIG